MKNQIFNQTNSSMENIPLYTELRVVYAFVCMYIEKKRHSLKTKITFLDSIPSIV